MQNPSKKEHLMTQEAVERLKAALDALPSIKARIEQGQQPNAYEWASGSGWTLCIGPVTDALSIVNVPHDDVAEFLEAALRVAILSLLNRGSEEGCDAPSLRESLDAALEALRRIAAFGQGERPEEPDHACGNAGDIDYQAARVAEWCLAQTAIEALANMENGQ